MTIKDAIHNLEQIRRVDGDAIVVYFDCPHCERSFTPDRVDRVVKVTAAKTAPFSTSKEPHAPPQKS